MTFLKKTILPLLLVAALLLLPGCDVLGSGGTQRVNADDVDNIRVTNCQTGKDFTIEDRDEIGKIVRRLNGYTLEDGTAMANYYGYALELRGSDGNTLLSAALADETTYITGGKKYTVDTKELLEILEALECDTMTDEELIRLLFEGDYLDGLDIRNEDGEISLDKILSLGSSCPALFELISRPSAMESLGSQGIELLKEYLTSDNEEWKARAEEIGQVIQSIVPAVGDKIQELLDTYGK